MKIKLIGLGQCGSFVVYDVIAYLFDHDESSKKIKAAPQSQWKRLVRRLLSKLESRGAAFRLGAKKFFWGLKTPDMPQFLVVDGNHKNAVVDGLLGEEINKKLGPLQVLVAALSLADRDNGCNLGQVGEYVFQKARTSDSRVFNKLKSNDQIEINALVFAGGGGSGSGGAPVLNEELRNKDSLLFNMLVLPPFDISDRRQRWNTGRCIMRLAQVRKQNALLLFSNLSESLNDQFSVNKYISKLIIRLANFGYTGNVPKVATDIDRKDLQAFFSGKPAFVGMSSLNKDIHEPSETNIEEMVDQALSLRKKQDNEEQQVDEENISGLSIEAFDVMEQMVVRQTKMIMIVIGLTPNYEGKVNIVNIIKRRIAQKLNMVDLSKLDCRVYSYTSPSEIELTVFFRHSNYHSSRLLNHFLRNYFEWYNGEQTEDAYLNKNIMGKVDNDFLDSLKSALEEEVDCTKDNWLENFRYQIDKELGEPFLPNKKGTVTGASAGD